MLRLLACDDILTTQIGVAIDKYVDFIKSKRHITSLVKARDLLEPVARVPGELPVD